jgi:hypothetical protein
MEFDFWSPSAVPVRHNPAPRKWAAKGSPHPDRPRARVRADPRLRPVLCRIAPATLRPLAKSPDREASAGFRVLRGAPPEHRGVGVSPSRGVGPQSARGSLGRKNLLPNKRLAKIPRPLRRGDLTAVVMKARDPATNPFQINGLARSGRYFGRLSAAAKVSAYSRETPPKRPPPTVRCVGSSSSNHKHLDRAALRKP